MPAAAIPLGDTALFSDFLNLADGINDTGAGPGNPYVDDTIYSLIHDRDIFPLERPVTATEPSKELEFIPENYRVRGRELRQYVLMGLSRVIEWKPNTDYFKEIRDSDNNLVRGPDIVTHDGSIYIVTNDFTSGSDFLEKEYAGDYTINLTRIKLDTDTDYVEITASANSPLLTGDVIGRYVSMRYMTVYKTYTLPNVESAAQSPNIEHKALCNGNITTDCTIKIMCERGGASPEHIGTITFTAPGGSFAVTEGVFTFNDSEWGPEANTRLNLDKGYLIYFEMLDVPIDLSWVAINILAAAEVSYSHPSFTANV